MNVIDFPDRSRFLSHADREAIVRFTARFPDANLEFKQENSHDVAIFCIGNLELCLLRQGAEVMVASLSWEIMPTLDTEVTVEAEAATVEAVLAILERRF